MKLTLKARRAIKDAIYLACDQVRCHHIHDLANRPPEDWDVTETRDFDIIGEVEMELYRRLDELVDGSVPPLQPRP